MTGLKICLNVFQEACESIIRVNELCALRTVTHMCTDDVSSKMFVILIPSRKTSGSFGTFVPCLSNYTSLCLHPR